MNNYISPNRKWLASLPRQTEFSVLGPKGSFSDDATNAMLYEGMGSDVCNNVRSVYETSMWDIHGAVNNRGRLGVLPFTNYSSTNVHENKEALFTQPWEIHAEIMYEVYMTLGGQGCKDLASVSDIYSKDVGLHQCCDYIQRNMPNARRHAMPSTGAAIEYVATSGNPRAVALGPRDAHLKHGNVIWAQGISNADLRGEPNVTHFVVVSRANAARVLTAGCQYHGLILRPADQPGVIATATEIMSDAGMNLFAQEQRPIGVLQNEFLYLMEDTHPDQSRVQEMVVELGENIKPAEGAQSVTQPISSWNARIWAGNLGSYNTRVDLSETKEGIRTGSLRNIQIKIALLKGFLGEIRKPKRKPIGNDHEHMLVTEEGWDCAAPSIQRLLDAREGDGVTDQAALHQLQEEVSALINKYQKKE